MRVLAVALLALWVGGCVTPMSDAEARRYTTCHGTDWRKIRKALIQNGYEVESENDLELVTAFGVGPALPVDDGEYRIVVRRLDRDSFRFVVLTRPGPEARPRELLYLEERRGEAGEIQRRVCGVE